MNEIEKQEAAKYISKLSIKEIETIRKFLKASIGSCDSNMLTICSECGELLSELKKHFMGKRHVRQATERDKVVVELIDFLGDYE